ncbi:MAG: hypothetical protein ACRDO2_07420 [Nocardioidaceae bacterium]
MTTTVITSSSDIPAEVRARRPRWAAFGLAAGLSGIVAIAASTATGAVYEEDIAGDAVAITDRLSEMVPQILVFHTATMLSTLLLVVFAAGLHRQLSHRLGPDSLLPTVASFGLLLVAVAGLLGSGLTTEFVFGVSDPDLLVPESAAFFGHWIGTIPWLWSGAGLTALVVAIAGLRHGVYARWLAWTSAVMGGLITLFAISPLQYMGGMVAPVWLTVMATALLMSDRERA